MADHFSEFDAFNVPPEFKPIGTFGYIGLDILFAIPIIGWIFLIVFCFSDANINRRNYARAHVIVFLLSVIIAIVLVLTGVADQMIHAAQTGEIPAFLKSLPFVK